MPRIRTVKPEYFTHPEIVELTIPARLLFLSLLCQADDAGRMYEQPLKIHALTFGDDDEIDTRQLLRELEEMGRIRRYVADGKRCIAVENFSKHQVIRRDRKSSIPAGHTEDGQIRPADGNVMQEQGTGNREQGTGKGTRKRNIPQDFQPAEAVAKWAQETHPHLDLATETGKFIDWHRSKGNRFADHDSAWRNWIRKAAEFNPPPAPRPDRNNFASSPPPSCEHAEIMCQPCRSAGAKRARELIKGIGDVA